MRTPVETWREGARSGHTHEPNEVTVQLDGLGRQLSELTAQPSEPEGSDGPVFVDESGRRSKTFRRLGWILAAACACYAVTLAVAVLGGSSSAPWLPLSGQEGHKNADVVRAPPAPTGGAREELPPGSAPARATTGPTPGSAATTSGSAAAEPEGSDGPGKDTPASSRVVSPKAHDDTGGGQKPGPVSSAPVPPFDTATPSTGTSTPSAGSTTPPAQSPEPPVQEREGTE
ncbi:hypothetical protein [Streptomyces sp. Ncost-T10-10d]|uniref:hypothetical protein n=1 Tax=Streptomyces sp. Ncost-T10-10d TaxID=1839774 RepID=UPI00081F084D|nr:hypothetical protein [Streptomyces sp. Ncost-T10-10d]SCF96923.1 hypothetical protein GA0115254_128410 [Streptomyces sp. Ncost-T10-10d]